MTNYINSISIEIVPWDSSIPEIALLNVFHMVIKNSDLNYLFEKMSLIFKSILDEYFIKY